MAETMVVEGDDTVGITGTVMRRAEDKGSQGTRKAHPPSRQTIDRPSCLLRGKPSLDSSRRGCERLVCYWSWFRSSGNWCF